MSYPVKGICFQPLIFYLGWSVAIKTSQLYQHVLRSGPTYGAISNARWVRCLTAGKAGTRLNPDEPPVKAVGRVCDLHPHAPHVAGCWTLAVNSSLSTPHSCPVIFQQGKSAPLNHLFKYFFAWVGPVNAH